MMAGTEAGTVTNAAELAELRRVAKLRAVLIKRLRSLTHDEMAVLVTELSEDEVVSALFWLEKRGI